MVGPLSVAIFSNFPKCKFQHFSRFLESIFIVCRRRWVVVQLSAVVLAGIYPDGISESCIFSEIWIFVFENHEKCVFFFSLKTFLFAPILPGKIACRNSKMICF